MHFISGSWASSSAVTLVPQRTHSYDTPPNTLAPAPAFSGGLSTLLNLETNPLPLGKYALFSFLYEHDCLPAATRLNLLSESFFFASVLSIGAKKREESRS